MQEAVSYVTEALPDCVGLLFCLFRPSGKLNFIDHVVGNQGSNQMADVVKNYEANLQFHRFWSIDDDLVGPNFGTRQAVHTTPSVFLHARTEDP